MTFPWCKHSAARSELRGYWEWFSWWKHPIPIKALSPHLNEKAGAVTLQKGTAQDCQQTIASWFHSLSHICLHTTVQRITPMRRGPFVRNPAPIQLFLKLPRKTGLTEALHTFWWPQSWTKHFYKEALCKRPLSHIMYTSSKNIILKCFIIVIHSLSLKKNSREGLIMKSSPHSKRENSF